jgi:hypothetical protein
LATVRAMPSAFIRLLDVEKSVGVKKHALAAVPNVTGLAHD